jgi:hypothetical protein
LADFSLAKVYASRTISGTLTHNAGTSVYDNSEIFERLKVSAPMTECNPRTAHPLHKIYYENSHRNFGYVGHPLVKCNTTFEFAQSAVKGSLSF